MTTEIPKIFIHLHLGKSGSNLRPLLEPLIYLQEMVKKVIQKGPTKFSNSAPK
jgi:hypothetical protein